MAQQTINVGTNPNDGTGDTLRGAFVKTDANFTELYSGKQNTLISGTNIKTINGNSILGSGNLTIGGITGSGTTNFVSKFTAAGAIGNSQIFDDGTNVGIGTSAPTSRLHIEGTFYSVTNNTFLEITTDVIQASAYSQGFILNETEAIFGYSPSGNQTVVKATQQGVWFRNESNNTFGLNGFDPLLFTKDLIQTTYVPVNPFSAVKWIRIYSENDAQDYLIPVYQ